MIEAARHHIVSINDGSPWVNLPKEDVVHRPNLHNVSFVAGTHTQLLRNRYVQVSYARSVILSRFHYLIEVNYFYKIINALPLRKISSLINFILEDG